MSIVYVCRSATFTERRITDCPTCAHSRRFVVETALWYGATWTCCGCGDSWTDGEMHPRPFKRGWREESIAKARTKWAATKRRDPAEWKAWFEEQMREPDDLTCSESDLGEVPDGQ